MQDRMNFKKIYSNLKEGIDAYMASGHETHLVAAKILSRRLEGIKDDKYLIDTDKVIHIRNLLSELCDNQMTEYKKGRTGLRPSCFEKSTKEIIDKINNEPKAHHFFRLLATTLQMANKFVNKPNQFEVKEAPLPPAKEKSPIQPRFNV